MTVKVPNTCATALRHNQLVGRSATALAIAIIWQLGGGVAAQAQDPHLGVIEYEISCLPCHGQDGRGDGPRANSLKAPPPNLRKIAKSNKGVFPARRLAEIIDGRAIVGGHGQREMPVWGDRYRIRLDERERSSEIERRVRLQIAALLQYLRTIQEK